MYLVVNHVNCRSHPELGGQFLVSSQDNGNCIVQTIAVPHCFHRNIELSHVSGHVMVQNDIVDGLSVIELLENRNMEKISEQIQFQNSSCYRRHVLKVS